MSRLAAVLPSCGQSFGGHLREINKRPSAKQLVSRVPWACLASASPLLEAAAAVNGTILAWLERYLRFLAAIGADRRIHLARTGVASARGATTSPTPFGAASWAPRGRVLQPSGSVEFLLPGSPDEVGPAIAAGQGLVRKAHFCPPLLVTLTSTVTEAAAQPGPPCPSPCSGEAKSLADVMGAQCQRYYSASPQKLQGRCPESADVAIVGQVDGAATRPRFGQTQAGGGGIRFLGPWKPAYPPPNRSSVTIV